MKIFHKVEVSKEKIDFIKKDENNHNICDTAYFVTLSHYCNYIVTLSFPAIYLK